MAGNESIDHQVSLAEHAVARQVGSKPVRSTGVLDSLAHEDLTPAIGRSYRNVNIIDDIMSAEDADDRLRELALVSKFASLRTRPQSADHP